jgi:hypothetical protein
MESVIETPPGGNYAVPPRIAGAILDTFLCAVPLIIKRYDTSPEEAFESPSARAVAIFIRMPNNYLTIGINCTEDDYLALGTEVTTIVDAICTRPSDSGRVNKNEDLNYLTFEILKSVVTAFFAVIRMHHITSKLPPELIVSDVFHLCIMLSRHMYRVEAPDLFDAITDILEYKKIESFSNVFIDFVSTKHGIAAIKSSFENYGSMFSGRYYSKIAPNHFLKAPFYIKSITMPSRFMIIANRINENDVRMSSPEVAIEFAIAVEQATNGRYRRTMYVSGMGVNEATMVLSVSSILSRAYALNDRNLIHAILPDVTSQDTVDAMEALGENDLLNQSHHYTSIFESMQDACQSCHIECRRSAAGQIGRAAILDSTETAIDVVRYMISFK